MTDRTSEEETFDPAAVVEHRESTGTGYSIGRYVIAAIVGVVGGFALGGVVYMIAVDLFRPAILTRSPVSQYGSLIWGLSVFIGGISGLYILSQDGLRRLLFLASYPFALFAGMIVIGGGLGSVLNPYDLISRSLYPQFTAVLMLMGALLGAEAWHQVYRRLVPDDSSSNPLPEVIGEGNRTRRGFLGLTATSAVAVGSLGVLQRQKVEQKGNEVITPDGVEVTGLSHGYSESEQTYRVSGTVGNNSDHSVSRLELEVTFYRESGSEVLTRSRLLGPILGSGESENFEMTVTRDEEFAIYPEDINRFVLVVSRR